MYLLVDEHRPTFGVEPIGRVLQIARSAYRRHAARRRDRSLLSPRAQRDGERMPKIERVWNTNLQVYGADKPDGAARRTGRSRRAGRVAVLGLVHVQHRRGLRPVGRPRHLPGLRTTSDQSSQVIIPRSFIDLFVEPGGIKPRISRADMTARHEFCEDLAQIPVDTAQDRRDQLRVSGSDVLDRIELGLRDPGIEQ